MKATRFFLYLTILVMALASCTTEEQPPTISYVFTDVSLEAGETSVVINCRNESVDDDKVFASVLLSKNENITDATKYPLRLQNDTLRSTINGLERNTMYFFCFEVYTANEHKRTDEVYHFSTQGANVSVTTLEAINITETGVTGGGNVTAGGDITVGMRGVCWDTVPNPNALQSPHLTSGEGTGTFMLNITGLKPNTAYYMKAYAVSGDVVYYGNEVSFVTLQEATVPTITTFQVSDITLTDALCGGNVTSDGGTAVTQRGVCWSASHNPTTSSNHTIDGTGTGSFTSSITGLSPNTTYYVRSYATNSVGTAYGTEMSFTTLSGFGPGEGSGTADDPYNVASGISLQGQGVGVWVQGYIVGSVKNGNTSVSSNDQINWSAPFDFTTNVLIADDPACREVSNCIIVNLPNNKPLRFEVNLVDHPENLGKQLAVRGSLRTYFGQAGLRDSDGTENDFFLEGGGTPPTPPPGETIFSESFANGQGDFVIDDVLKPGDLNYVWAHAPSYSCMKASGYVGQAFETESWLVSPAISLVGVGSARLEFDQAVNYGSPQGVLKVMISTNFAGSVTAATWNELNLNRWPDGNNWLFITSSADLTNYAGQTVTIAFKYTSNTSVNPTWEIKNVVVK